MAFLGERKEKKMKFIRKNANGVEIKYNGNFDGSYQYLLSSLSKLKG